MKRKGFWLRGFGCILLAFGFLSFFAARWAYNVYDNVTFDAILFTILSGLTGMDAAVAKDFAVKVFLPTVLLTAAAALPFCHNLRYQLRIQKLRSGKEIWLSPLRPGTFLAMSAVICVLLAGLGAKRVKLDVWLRNLRNTSDLLEVYYVNPADVEITFPEKKRNLVYIFLEAMDTGLLSAEEGGGMDTSRMPELARLAQENLNFSNTDAIGGYGLVSGASWTTGAMVEKFSGIPLLTPFSEENLARVLPGVTTFWDILAQNGYNQAVLMGSESEFSGQNKLLLQHGVNRLFDYAAAVEEGLVPEDYYVWWGIEDWRVYEQAKKELTEMSAGNQPFAMTVISIDTHFPDGYACELCREEFEDPYENVYACASRQAEAFVRWLQEQPFYENTTVIICGDHLNKDVEYLRRSGLSGFDHRVYNCFLNAPLEPVQAKNREFTPMDMFPTILASLNCKIEGERLGLGTNLFSDRATLAEEMGLSQLNQEIDRSVLPYLQKFMLDE